jgi:hypothetical protein
MPVPLPLMIVNRVPAPVMVSACVITSCALVTL